MMKDKNQIIKQQKNFISELKQKTLDFISKIDKTEIETILLSGSVARGDYFPGKYGGMTDLIIMRKPGSMISPEELLGENQDPGIPYHCVCSEGNWFEILFSDFIDIEKFQMLDEARKSAIMESTVLFDKAGKYGSQSEKIKELTREYCRKELKRNIEYIRYLISDYKKDRWYRREAFLQLHENLNTAINAGIKCFFYINDLYPPAEDRRLYYSFSLKELPENYREKIPDLKTQIAGDKNDYFRREKIFREVLLNFIEKKAQPTPG